MAAEATGAAAHVERPPADGPYPADAPESAAEAEEATTRALGALSSEGWRVFHEVRWPGRAQLGIDHVLVGPGGVFVINTATWGGEVDVRGGALRQDGKRRARHVIASAAAAMAIGELLPGLPPSSLLPVICFAREEPLFGWVGDVMICSRRNIVPFLTSRPRVLAEAQMTDIAEALSLRLQCASERLPPPVASVAEATSTQPLRRAAVRRRERLPRRPVPRRVRAAGVIAAAAVAATITFHFDVPARLGELGVSAAHRVVEPTRPIGATVRVPGLGSRPSLSVHAGAPVLTRSLLPGVTVTPGHELVAIPLSVHNTGDRTWHARDALDAVLTDTAGTPYSSDPAYTSVSAGRALPAAFTLAADARRSGLVVFEVPHGTVVATVQVQVGSRLPTTLHWSVG